MLDLSYMFHDMTNTNTDNKTEERKNRFTGESIMLTKEEARRHDCIFLAEVMATLHDKKVGHGMSKQMRKVTRIKGAPLAGKHVKRMFVSYSEHFQHK